MNSFMFCRQSQHTGVRKRKRTRESQISFNQLYPINVHQSVQSFEMYFSLDYTLILLGFQWWNMKSPDSMWFQIFCLFLKKYFIQKWIFRHYSLPNVTHMTFYLQWNTKGEFWRIFLTSNESKRDCIKSTIQKYYKSGSLFFK